jgi:hypothetical protein
VEGHEPERDDTQHNTSEGQAHQENERAAEALDLACVVMPSVKDAPRQVIIAITPRAAQVGGPGFSGSRVGYLRSIRLDEEASVENWFLSSSERGNDSSAV